MRSGKMSGYIIGTVRSGSASVLQISLFEHTFHARTAEILVHCRVGTPFVHCTCNQQLQRRKYQQLLSYLNVTAITVELPSDLRVKILVRQDLKQRSMLLDAATGRLDHYASDLLASGNRKILGKTKLRRVS